MKLAATDLNTPLLKTLSGIPLPEEQNPDSF